MHTQVPGLLQQTLRQRRAQLAEQMIDYDTPTDTAGTSRAGWGRSTRGGEVQSSFGARRGRGRGRALSAVAHLLSHQAFFCCTFASMSDVLLSVRSVVSVSVLERRFEACTVRRERVSGCT